MPQFKTPGVYVKETSTLAPSVAGISTAIPVFIGYTEITNRKTGQLPTPVRINSMLEYSQIFGGEFIDQTTVTISGNSIASIASPNSSYLIVPSLRIFFNNGGGSCYIISLGAYNNKIFTKQDFVDGLSALEKEDEPTLILLIDAVNLAAVDYHDLSQQALLQCGTLKDRFCILDVLNTTNDTKKDISAFRDNIGNNNLMYGAAYYPYLRTSLTHPFTDDSVIISGYVDTIKEYINNGKNGLGVYYVGSDFAAVTPKVTITQGTNPTSTITVSSVNLNVELASQAPTAKELEKIWIDMPAANKGNFNLKALGSGATKVIVTASKDLVLSDDISSEAGTKVTLAELQYDQTELYNTIKGQLSLQRMTLPPSAAIAGIYAATDRNIGVWKAPANVGVASVIEPVKKLNSLEQEDLNIDPVSGKSINVIRAFTGRGVIVWGGRTLLGNDNEWRYINVRRLFSVVEESVQKSTQFAVFEPNTPLTWLKVRAMIESYLEDLWKAGGLVGTTKQQAYFVNIGLGSTMTSQDILEGRMKVDIGLAASRPAEFIIINFTHLLQQA